jgi:hypothetical protein
MSNGSCAERAADEAFWHGGDGLGVIGRRMLEHAPAIPGLQVVAAYDNSAQARSAAAAA